MPTFWSKPMIKLGFIVLVCSTAGLAVARPGRSTGKSSIRTGKPDVNAPPLRSLSPSPGARPLHEARAKVTVYTGPHREGYVSNKNGGILGTGESRSINKASSGSMETTSRYKAKLLGWGGEAARVDTEATANRVKVKMDIHDLGFAIVDRKLRDGSWKQDVILDPGTHRKYYRNQDGSAVTVKSSLLGGGYLRTTADVYPQPMKAGRQYEAED